MSNSSQQKQNEFPKIAENLQPIADEYIALKKKIAKFEEKLGDLLDDNRATPQQWQFEAVQVQIFDNISEDVQTTIRKEIQEEADKLSARLFENYRSICTAVLLELKNDCSWTTEQLSQKVNEMMPHRDRVSSSVRHTIPAIKDDMALFSAWAVSVNDIFDAKKAAIDTRIAEKKRLEALEKEPMYVMQKQLNQLSSQVKSLAEENKNLKNVIGSSKASGDDRSNSNNSQHISGNKKGHPKAHWQGDGGGEERGHSNKRPASLQQQHYSNSQQNSRGSQYANNGFERNGGERREQQYHNNSQYHHQPNDNFKR